MTADVSQVIEPQPDLHMTVARVIRKEATSPFLAAEDVELPDLDDETRSLLVEILRDPDAMAARLADPARDGR